MTDDSRQENASEEESDDGSASFESYSDYNRVLRTWFVAFGVGGPALFLVNDQVARTLSASGNLRFVAVLFLGGAACQVTGAFVNKVGNWYCYRAKLDNTGKPKFAYILCNWIIDQFWFDVLLDLATIVMFGIAAWEVLTVFAGAS